VSIQDGDTIRGIEEVIASHPNVAEVSVVAIGEGAQKRLLAVIVPVDFASGPEIRDYAWQRIGDGSVPDSVALLSALPRDVHGGVDMNILRSMLAASDDVLIYSYVPPVTPHERAVAEIFREVLEVPRVGLDDGFLDLGGDSIHAMEVTNLLAERMDIHLSQEEFFEAATVRNISRVTGS
jgi:nonribosomal peptide synthetase DhbF